MKKTTIISSILGLIICVLMLCFGVWNINNENNLKVEQSKRIEIIKTTKNSPSIKSKNNIVENLTTNDLIKYFNITKKDILTMEEIKDADNLDDGTVSLMESHMFFPCVYSKKHGLSFIFPAEESSETPSYLYLNSETNIANINIKGAKPGMKFEEIFGFIGKTSVKKTWMASEDNTAYKIDYNLDGLNYSFVSNEEDGNGSDLYISLPWD